MLVAILFIILLFILIAILMPDLFKNGKRQKLDSEQNESKESTLQDNKRSGDKIKITGTPITDAVYPHQRLAQNPPEVPINSDISFDIFQMVNSFLDSRYAKAIGDTIFIVLDSTCVKQSESSLTALQKASFDSRIKFAITKDSYYELKILEGSSIYSKRAKILLQITQKNHLDFSVQDLYRTKEAAPRITIEELNDKAAYYFLFNSFATFDEFIKLVYPKSLTSLQKNNRIFVTSLCKNERYTEDFKNAYLLTYYSDFVSRNSATSCLNQNSVQSEYRIVQPIKNKNLDQIEKLSRSIKAIEIFSNSKSFRYAIDEKWDTASGNGGEANIYAHPDKPNECIKIYNNSLPCDNKLRKIMWLMDHTDVLPRDSISLPTGIVYAKKCDITSLHSTSDERVCIGYTMKKFSGATLTDAIKEYAIAEDGPLREQNSSIPPSKENLDKKKNHLRQIIRLCLELKMVDVFFVDIKLSNIIVDNSNNIKFIDCDSYEVGTLPSEGVTGAYTHKDILNLGKNGHSFGSFLKEPRYFDFSLATLAYRIYMASEAGILDTPQRQQMYENDELIWSNERIGFSLPEYPDGKPLNEEYWFVEEGWKYILNQKQRSLFFNTFNFKRIYGIGSLANEFELN